jgi:Acetyl/propionyl-CoA carboxylase, alpha subunit
MTTTGPITRLLIANRGEIAARIIRSTHALGIATVAVYSDPDAAAPYVTLADEAVRLPGAAPADTYLRGDLIIAAAAAAGADAIHPGYGFLSENAAFARACADAGLTFVGPPARDHRGDGRQGKGEGDHGGGGRARPAQRHRYRHHRPGPGFRRGRGRWLPAAGQGRFGGGGRGMRLVADPAELAEAVSSARSEAASAFGDGTVFLERFVTDPRHVEVQILGDAIRRRGPPVRARVLHPAPLPEDRGGVPVAGVDDDLAGRADRRGRRGRLGDRLHRRGHR